MLWDVYVSLFAKNVIFRSEQTWNKYKLCVKYEEILFHEICVNIWIIQITEFLCLPRPENLYIISHVGQ